MDRLVDALEQRRKSEKVLARDFAERIGVSEATYSRVRRGQLPAGRRFITGALRAFPELAVLLAMDAQDTNGRESEKVPA